MSIANKNKREIIERVRVVETQNGLLVIRMDELLDALRKAIPVLESAAEPDSVYGFFHDGDPRDFAPDPEASTERERESHRLACEAFGKSSEGLPGCCERVTDERGGRLITRAPFGLGVNSYQDENAAIALAAARAAIAKAEGA